MIDELGRLSEEDLCMWQTICAWAEVARSGHPGMTPEECAQAIVREWVVGGALAEKYEIDDDDCPAAIDPCSGIIVSAE